MLLTWFAVIIRIVSNSYLNVFQKVLTSRGNKSSVVNFFTYLGLTIAGLLFIGNLNINSEMLVNVLIMGLLGALGNFFIIKALSIGELSVLAPINSFKPVVALLAGAFFLKEIPSARDFLGIIFIIIGSIILVGKIGKNVSKYSLYYRILALIFSGSEAVFIKKVILLSSFSQAFFLWAFAGFIFSFLLVITSHNKVVMKNSSIKYQMLLILAVGIMQYSTNFVFSKVEVSSALALFQLSTLLSVFLGANIFHEKDFLRKFIASSVMVLGAVIIIL